MKKQLRLIGFMLICMVHQLHAQTKATVTGKVTDQGGQPMVGVSVRVEGPTPNGVQTDSEGKYSIQLKKGDIVTFSYISFETKTVNWNGTSVLNVILKENATTLNEVVALGYVTTTRAENTGSISSINAKEIQRANATDVLSVIQGRTPGVQIVSNDGAPGGGFTLNVRGSNSITAGTTPLLVVDGIPFVPPTDEGFNPFSFINPNDIETIDVLKDAAATALYGAEAAAGVIVITTKKGKLGEPRINVLYNTGYSYVPQNRIPGVQSDEAYVSSMAARVAARPPLPDFGGGNPWLARVGTDYYKNGNDWFDLITDNVVTQKFALDFSSATEKTNYRASVGYDDENGIVIGSGFKRFTAKFNITQQFGKKVKISLNTQYANTKYEGLYSSWGGFGSQGLVAQSLFTNPFQALDDPLGENVLDDPLFSFGGLTAGQQNPLTYINDVSLDRNSDFLQGNFQIDYKITNDLTFNTTVGSQFENRELNRFVPATTREGLIQNGILNLNNNKNFNYVLLSKLGYRKTFNSKHNINLDGVIEAKKYSNDSYSQIATNLLVPSLEYYSGSTTTSPNAPLRTLEVFSTASALMRAAYSFDQKYIINGSVRLDASSRFGENNKTAIFPAVSFAWVLSKEKFIENLKLSWLDNAKIRGSFGVVGNNQIRTYTPYSTLAILQAGGVTNRYTFYGGGSPSSSIALGANSISNPDLRWESTKSYDAGLDLAFLKGRLNFVADVYYKQTDDLLLDVDQVAYNGVAERALVNIGSLENRGLELSLNGTIIKKKDFTFDAGFNISFNRNKVLNLGASNELFFNRTGNFQDLVIKVGEPIGNFRGFILDGVYNNDIERNNSAVDLKQPSKALGLLRIADIDGDGFITNDDRVTVGNTLPVHIGGITTTFGYKNFELYAFGRWSYGNDVVNVNADQSTEARYNNKILASVDGQQWSPQQPNNNYFGLVNSNRGNLGGFRSESIEDGSFFRLDRVTLSYNVPAKTLSKYKINNLRLSLTGTNLLVITRYSWFDPEVNTGFGSAAKLGPGVDSSAYPRMRSFNFGLNFGF